MELEQLALEWADRCEFKHPNKTLFPRYYGVGQNLALRGNHEFSYDKVVNSWANESQYYEYNTGACGKVCGHYTQVCWV